MKNVDAVSDASRKRKKSGDGEKDRKMRKSNLNIPQGTIRGSRDEQEQKREKKKDKEEKIQDYLEVLKQMHRK